MRLVMNSAIIVGLRYCAACEHARLLHFGISHSNPARVSASFFRRVIQEVTANIFQLVHHFNIVRS